MSWSDKVNASYWTLRMFVLLVFGACAGIWSLAKFGLESFKKWDSTTGILMEIHLHERTRNKQQEFFLKSTHRYLVDGKTYHLNADHILITSNDSNLIKREIEVRDSTKRIYYNVDIPEEATFEDPSGERTSLILFSFRVP